MSIVLHHDIVSRPLDAPKLVALSLGAGVQSSTLALMADRGDLGRKPDVAFFADTGNEPAKVYEYLDWLEKQLSYPIIRIRAPKSLVDALKSGDDSARIPAFVAKGGLATRQCTRNWKLRPIRRAIRQFMGVSPTTKLAPNSVEIWVGISMDEIVRLKPSGAAWLYNRHPIVEARMTRGDCLRWLTERQYRIPPKSACWCCPFTDNARWLDMQQNAPEDFEQACVMDDWFGEPAQIERFRGRLHLHHQLKPLREVDFTKPMPVGLSFLNECEGMCGV